MWITRIAILRRTPPFTRPPDRRVTGAFGAAALLGLGLVLATAVAGCGGGGGGVTAGLSTRTAAGTAAQPTVDQTTNRQPAVTLTRTQTVQTQTQTVQTQTVQTQTLQQTVIAPPATTTTQTNVTITTQPTSSSSGTPAWVWVLVAVGGLGLIGLVVWLVTRRRSGPDDDERARIEQAAVQSWVAQGWAIESQVEGSTIVRRNGERMMLSVDADGHVASVPLSAREPLGPRSDGPSWPGSA